MCHGTRVEISGDQKELVLSFYHAGFKLRSSDLAAALSIRERSQDHTEASPRTCADGCCAC